MAQDLQSKMEDKLFLAAENGNLQIFKHIMESPSLRQYVNIAENGYQTLKVAARNCNEDFLDYILQLPEVNEKIMTKVVSYTFANACYKEEFDIIHFYFNNEKYNKYLDLTYNSTWCFRTAYSNRNDDVLKFLIIEAELPKNEDVMVEIACEKKGDPDFVNRLFDKREMKNELTQDLSIQENKHKTVKKV
jgi:hypothetical protein